MSNSQKSEMADAAEKRNHREARMVVMATGFIQLV